MEGHVYTNQNGNLAISKEVLEEFRKLDVVWERDERCWRKRTNLDKPARA